MLGETVIELDPAYHVKLTVGEGDHERVLFDPSPSPSNVWELREEYMPRLLDALITTTHYEGLNAHEHLQRLLLMVCDVNARLLTVKSMVAEFTVDEERIELIFPQEVDDIGCGKVVAQSQTVLKNIQSMVEFVDAQRQDWKPQGENPTLDGREYPLFYHSCSVR